MSLVTLGSAPCSRLLGQAPAWGRAWFDVDLTDDVALSGAQTLTIGALTWRVFVIAGGTAEGKARYRCVAGAGGWGRTIDAKPYHNDAGVKAATVIRDAAVACGESVGALPRTVLGPHFARAGGDELDAASDILHLLAPQNWYVDTAGVTQIGSWPAATYTGDGARVRTDLARGVIELAVDDVTTSLLPGVSVDGHGPATDVEYDIDAKRATVRVYFKRALSRRLRAWQRIVHALDPHARYRGVWEYRVVSQSGQRFNLQPVRVSSGMPDLRRVPTRGLPGIKATVALAEHVLVAFADCDPSRPNIIAHAAPDAAGWLPTLIEFGSGADPFARKSDLDAMKAELDVHVHPHALGPTSPPAVPFTTQPGSSLVKGQ